MTRSALDQIGPDLSTATCGDAGAFDRVRRLVPCSGLQFVDTTIAAGHLPMLRAWFTEDEIETQAGKQRVLLPLSADATGDGTVWHPLTFKPLGPSETLSYTGLEALEPFLNTWLPLPYQRYLGRAESGAPRFDHGPANWARVYVAKPAEGLRGADELKAVFAFDTRLDLRSRADQTAYLAPNADDALFASTFMLADDPDQLTEFLAQGWVDSWIGDACRAHAASAAAFDEFDEAGRFGLDATDSAFALAHVARYLTFLKILKRAAAPPQIRFVDSISRSLPAPVRGADLVIDFGPAETTAMLVASTQPRGSEIGFAARQASGLRLRDLSNPVEIHTGQIPSVVEFDNQTFGNSALSRRSGRNDAFAWTSLVRIGHEARRLALRANATDGTTGLADIASGLAETAAAEAPWRFSTPDTDAAKAGRMVSGEALRHLSETGDVTFRPDGLLTGPTVARALQPVLRPRFSPSAIVGFFVVELLLHAISQVNAAGPDGQLNSEHGEPASIGRIERIIVTSPIAMHAEERQLLLERVRTAIDLIWRTQQWEEAAGSVAPALATPPRKPEIVLGLSADVGLQFVHVFNEVRDKFGGSFSEYVDCVRRRSGEPNARDCLRVSSMELGRRSAAVTVVDYDLGHDGTVEAGLVLADRTANGGDRVVDAILETIILPAIESALDQAGAKDAGRFLSGYIGIDGKAAASPSASVRPIEGKRLHSKVLRPAAAGLFEAYIGMPERGAEGIRRYKIEHLVAAGGGRLDPAAQAFEAAAADAGAREFVLGSLALDVGRRAIERIVAGELWPIVDAMAGAVGNSDSDLLLLGGELAGLPGLLDHVLAHAPVPAARIVSGGRHCAGTGRANGPAKAHENGSFNGRDTALLGAYMAGRDMLTSVGFALTTGQVARKLALDASPHAGAIGRASIAGGSEAAASQDAAQTGKASS